MSELISGKEALIALANGKEVQCTITGKDEWTKDIYGIQPYYFLGGGVGQFQFRLKPHTIMMNNIEVPAPFEPKQFEDCFMLTDLYEHGYTKTSWKYCNSVPAWRTEYEIKQVVAALRSVFKGE